MYVVHAAYSCVPVSVSVECMPVHAAGEGPIKIYNTRKQKQNRKDEKNNKNQCYDMIRSYGSDVYMIKASYTLCLHVFFFIIHRRKRPIRKHDK